MKFLTTWILAIFAIAFVAVLTTGCGHNMVVYSDGVGLDTTINPETYTFGLNFRYGKIIQATVKDNTKIQLAANGTLNNAVGSSGSTSQTTGVQAPAELTIETGNQVTGYEVDLVKALSANPEAMKVWLEVRKSFADKLVKAAPGGLASAATVPAATVYPAVKGADTAVPSVAPK